MSRFHFLQFPQAYMVQCDNWNYIEAQSRDKIMSNQMDKRKDF